MVKSLKCAHTQDLFHDLAVAKLRSFERPARRKLLYLNRARNLDDSRNRPANHLETLKGDRKGQHSIRINDQWRLCFTWMDGDVMDVEIVDYR